MTDVLRLQRDDPRAWMWMPYVLGRIHRFCVVYDTESTPNKLVDLALAWFACGDPRLGLWVAVDPQAGAVGHLLAHPEPLDDAVGPWRYCLIRQAEVESGWDLRREAKQAFEEVCRWAELLRIPKLTILTRKGERAMYRRWGFRPHRNLMVRDVHLRVPESEDQAWAGATPEKL